MPPWRHERSATGPFVGGQWLRRSVASGAKIGWLPTLTCRNLRIVRNRIRTALTAGLSFPQPTLRKTVECQVSVAAFQELRLPEGVRERARRVGDHYAFELSGQLHYVNTGILYGVLPTGPR